jgi:hypothetical protein
MKGGKTVQLQPRLLYPQPVVLGRKRHAQPPQTVDNDPPSKRAKVLSSFRISSNFPSPTDPGPQPLVLRNLVLLSDPLLYSSPKQHSHDGSGVDGEDDWVN